VAVDLLLQLSLVEETGTTTAVVAGGATTAVVVGLFGTMTALETEVGTATLVVVGAATLVEAGEEEATGAGAAPPVFPSQTAGPGIV
jgi:hypothetical protein